MANIFKKIFGKKTVPVEKNDSPKKSTSEASPAQPTTGDTTPPTKNVPKKTASISGITDPANPQTQETKETVQPEKKKMPEKSEPLEQSTKVTTDVTENTPSLTGKFIIKQAKDGSYMFNLKASNGEIVATSDMYSSIENCRKGIASVQTNAPIANLEDHTVDGAVEEVVNPKFELYHDKGGDFRFRLKARNGSIIAKSQGYSSKSSCQNGIESVRKNAMSDMIEDETVSEDRQSAVSPVETPEEVATTKVTAAQEETPATVLMGKFFIKQAKDGSYMFNLKASNGEIIATSDMYSSLEKCKKGVASVQMNAPIANLEDHAVDGAVEEVVNPKFELYHDKGGDFRFRLKARNGAIIAKSQGYTSKSNCQNGIESVRKNAMSDEIVMEDEDN